jgi:Zn finger protein HypA/HybF involved in hydrogenase expression
MLLDEFKLKELVNNGFSNKEIALICKTSRSTVVRNKSFFNLSSNFHKKKHENKKCLQCELEFDCLKSENRIFCSHSCSAIYNNSIRANVKEDKYESLKIKNGEVIKECINCKLEFKIDSRNFSTHKYRKYCSVDCHKEYGEESRFLKIKNGEIVSNRTIKIYLIKNHGNKCMKCGWCEVNSITGKVPIELEHIDGNSENNSLENLSLLCPNCHSLTPTYKALNKGNGRYARMTRYKEGKSF